MKKACVGFLALMLLLMMCACFGCKKGQEVRPKKEEVIPVTVGKVNTMDVIYRLQRVGSIEAKESVMVKAESEGRVTGIFFEEGDKVAAGKLLVKLDDTKIKTTMSQLQARLSQLEIERANSERTLERKKPLVNADLISKQDFDDLETKISIERETIKEVKAQLAHNQELLNDTEIVTPFSGTTSERHVSIGDFLRVGDPIVRVVQLNPLEVSFRVDESYKSRLYPGQPLIVKVSAFADKDFHGEVYFVSPDIDIDTRSFLVKSRIANDENLLNPGMFAEVSMVTETHKDAVVVPWESVVQLENEVYVYLLNTDSAKKVPVRLGLVSGGVAEVFGELKPGQIVVKDGKYALREGAKVRIEENAKSS